MPEREPIDFDGAIEQVEAWLKQATGKVERRELECPTRIGDPDVLGWRVMIVATSSPRAVDIFVKASFPFTPPKIVLVDRPPFLTWPHVEKDGTLCLTTEAVTYSPYDPVGVVAHRLDLAMDLVAKCEAGDTDAEFHSEVLSYWDHATDYKGSPVISIMAADGGSRLIRAWWGRGFTLAGDDDRSIRDWLAKGSGGSAAKKAKTQTAVYVRLERALLPAEYPKTTADVLALADAAGAQDLLVQALQDLEGRLLVALGMETDNGLAVAGVVLTRPARRRDVDPLTKGFRTGRSVPTRILAARFFGADVARRVSLERSDAAWVHGRCQDERFRTLRNAKVLLFGCGSVGAPIAVTLAQAGVGSMVLVDHDLFSSANAGRHPLGVWAWRRAKAASLKGKLLADLPHMNVEATVQRAQAVIMGPANAMEGFDLIVSAMGDWPAERLLDEWHHAQGRSVPILYAWTEPRASAGHAVLVAGEGTSLQQGMDDTGRPLLTVTQWPNGDTKLQVPACGAVFEPYGPVEMSFITAMAAELSMDSLLGQVNGHTHRIWASSRSFLARAGGRWTPEWEALPDFRDDGGYVTHRRWAENASPLAVAA